jgi:hypothetical protein
MTFSRRRLPLAYLLAPVLVLALTVMPSCGGGAGDQTTKFLGTWTFTSGQLTPTCALITTPFSLTGLPVVFTKVDDSTISLGLGTACAVKFKVAGAKATVEPQQTCTLDVGALGPQTVAIDKWTLSLSGDQIDNDIAGSILICTASGTAVLMRGGPDGGAPDADAGKHEAGAEVANADGGAPESGATDGAPESGATDGAPESGATDTAPEAGADGGSEAGQADAAGTETGSPDAGEGS